MAITYNRGQELAQNNSKESKGEGESQPLCYAKEEITEEMQLDFNAEIDKGVKIINDAIKRYQIVDPLNNVVISWDVKQDKFYAYVAHTKYWPMEQYEPIFAARTK